MEKIRRFLLYPVMAILLMSQFALSAQEPEVLSIEAFAEGITREQFLGILSGDISIYDSNVTIVDPSLHEGLSIDEIIAYYNAASIREFRIAHGLDPDQGAVYEIEGISPRMPFCCDGMSLWTWGTSLHVPHPSRSPAFCSAIQVTVNTGCTSCGAIHNQTIRRYPGCSGFQCGMLG